MPVLGGGALLLTIIGITLAVHAARSGRASPWVYIILFLPGIGSLAYVIAEVLPEWLGTYQGQKTRARVGRAINPERTYRALKTELEIADTVANRSALADECLALGRFEEAKVQYDAILAMPAGEEPRYMVGRARAEFGLHRFAEVRATLDELRQRWPDWQSGDGHLIYARALEEDGRLAEAVDEYRALSNYYAGAEPRVRLGLALRRLGREFEARTVLEDVVRQMRLAPKFARRAQAEWIAKAEAALRA
jgi:hypothetical protein